MLKYLPIALILSSCALPLNLDHTTSPELSTVRVRATDTLRVTTQELVQAKKIKNRGTIIVQVGESNNASVVGKAKVPVAVGCVPTATATKESRGFLDYIWILFAGVAVSLYFKYRHCG